MVKQTVNYCPIIQLWLTRHCIWNTVLSVMGFPGGSVVKNLPANAGDMGSISGSGRFPGEGNGDVLQYSYLGNLMDRSLQSMGLKKSWT